MHNLVKRVIGNFFNRYNLHGLHVSHETTSSLQHLFLHFTLHLLVQFKENSSKAENIAPEQVLSWFELQLSLFQPDLTSSEFQFDVMPEKLLEKLSHSAILFYIQFLLPSNIDMSQHQADLEKVISLVLNRCEKIIVNHDICINISLQLKKYHPHSFEFTDEKLITAFNHAIKHPNGVQVSKRDVLSQAFELIYRTLLTEQQQETLRVSNHATVPKFSERLALNVIENGDIEFYQQIQKSFNNSLNSIYSLTHEHNQFSFYILDKGLKQKRPQLDNLHKALQILLPNLLRQDQLLLMKHFVENHEAVFIEKLCESLLANVMPGEFLMLVNQTYHYCLTVIAPRNFSTSLEYRLTRLAPGSAALQFDRLGENALRECFNQLLLSDFVTQIIERIQDHSYDAIINALANKIWDEIATVMTDACERLPYSNSTEVCPQIIPSRIFIATLPIWLNEYFSQELLGVSYDAKDFVFI